jgi:peptide/nickel transport system permease protein
VLGALLTLFGVATVVFIILHLTGDPAALMLPPEATSQDIALFRHEHGFDRPILVQYADFVSHAVHGDFGDSLRHGQPALSIALERFPASAELALTAMVFAVLVAVPAGVIAATRRNSLLDYAARIFALLGQSTPTYWLGIMFILFFGVALGWLPVSGHGGIRHLILPAATLGLFSMAKLMRLTRGAMLDILRSDYLRTAVAKGLSPFEVLVRHALRNAWLPIVTTIGIEFGTLLSQAIITETIFSWPGIGRLAVQAIFDRDYPVVEAITVLSAAVFVLINLTVDMTYAALDPRIRLDR